MTSNKDALEAWNNFVSNSVHAASWFLPDSLNTIRAALSQPTLTEYDTVYNAWQLLKAERDDEAFQVLGKLVKCKKQPTYDPETHILIAREDHASLLRFKFCLYNAYKYCVFNEDRATPKNIMEAIEQDLGEHMDALIAQKTEE